MTIKGLTASVSALLFAASVSAAEPKQAAPAVFDSATISGLGARNIGSATMSGRVSALAGVVDEGKVKLYVGAASGGVWRSEDGGTTFKPLFDKQDTQSIGAIAIDPNDRKVIWVGTGEVWTRNSVSIGTGIFRSGDGGDTWTKMGLEDSERIAGITVHPKDSNTVYACVPGKLWSDSTERGLYKTTNGGRTWTLVLKGGNPSTGCSTLALDPTSPDTVYAGLWDFRRKGWTFRSGGESAEAKSGSGLFKSPDGGASWTQVTDAANKGFPRQPIGRIALALAPSNPKIVYAFVEGADAALYRSGDGGATWDKRDKSQSMVWRPFYFAHLVVDPKNPDKLFKPNYQLIVSNDGGKTFANSGGSMHADWHDIWINPENPRHVVGGTDGGLGISYDGGNRWDMVLNLPISQFYHVSVDERDPYQVYGGLQDNSSWVGDSSYPGGVSNARWENMYGGDGFWMFSDPSDPNYVYAESQGGDVVRINRQTREIRSIQPQAGYGEKLRWNWNTPIHLSPNEKGTLYVGSQFLFRSRDQGASWDRISPDLTTNDKDKQRQEESGGITVDNSAAEMHTTVYSISESPKDKGTLWVGTDDGNVQVTRDASAKEPRWTNVTGNIKGLPKASWVSWVEASRHDAATAYAVFDRHTFGDMNPYAYVTRDYGKTWKAVVAPGQGVRGYAHVLKEDLVDPDLLFLGTEFGLWISNDGGRNWAAFKGGNFPAVAVRDMVVHARNADLVLGTHGRGIWVIDDVTPLRALEPELLARDAAFVEARPTQQRIASFGGWAEGDSTFTGPSEPQAAQITYYQRTRHLFGRLKLEIIDPEGKVLDTLPASKRRGLNRVSWSMRVKAPRVPPAAGLAYASTQGARVLPGVYTVRMTKGKDVYESKLTIGMDRRAGYGIEDRQAQFAAAQRVSGLFTRMSDLSFKVAAVRDQAGKRAQDPAADAELTASLAKLSESADRIRKQIVATKEGGAITGEERLRENMDKIYGAILFYEGRPAPYLIERTDVMERELGDVEKGFAELEAGELAATNEALKAKGRDPIAVPAGAPDAATGQGPKKGGELDLGPLARD